MSIRILLCFALVGGFSIYAWRNWFVSLCAAVLLMGLLQHPDMPKSIFDIQGLNPWNVLMLNVTLAWLTRRRREGLTWDMPRATQAMFFIYVGSIAITTVRMLMNPDPLLGPDLLPLISEYVINTFKWFVPGIILFDACRTRRRVEIALVVICALYVILALQVIQHVPLKYASGGDFGKRAYRLVQNSVGYNRVTLSMMLGGACWATLSLVPLAANKKQKWAFIAAAASIAMGQSLTGGRSGYLSWTIVGVILCVARWRRMLPLIPVVIVIVGMLLPSVRDRMLQGLGLGDEEVDAYAATSGRNIAWPFVIDQIMESPLFGYGRQGMTQSGVFMKILEETEETESFPHPHNAYLETLLDSGITGFFCVIPFLLMLLWQSLSLFLDKSDTLCGAAGGMFGSLMLALLVAAMGGQTFYPREGAVGMWAAAGVMLRVYAERRQARQLGQDLFQEEEEPEEAEPAVKVREEEIGVEAW